MKKSIFILSAFALVVFSASVMAGPVGPPPNSVPIDGGLGLVVAGCVGYAVKKVYGRAKKN